MCKPLLTRGNGYEQLPYSMSDTAILPNENDKKDRLTRFYIKKEVHPNLENTFTNCAPITYLPPSMTVLS